MAESILAVLGKVISWTKGLVAAEIKKIRQQHEIQELLRNARMRAAMINSSVNLADRFSNSILVDELIENLRLKEKTRDESIALFLDGGDSAAIEFMEKFCSEVDRIISPTEDSLASVKTLRLVEEEKADIQRLIDQLAASQEDVTAQLSLLEEVIGFVESGEMGVAHLCRLSHSAGNSLASKYLAAYVSLCKGQEPDLAQLPEISGRDTLALALASVAISSMKLDVATAALKLCSFDAGPIIGVINNLAVVRKQAGRRQIMLSGVVSSLVEKFLNLINFDVFFCEGAFYAAARYANGAKIAWNPIAIEERSVSELISAVAVNNEDLQSRVQQEISRYGSWFPDGLREQFICALSASFLRLDRVQVQELISELPDSLSSFAEDEKKRLELGECDDPEAVRRILIWAEARHNPLLMIETATKLCDLDNMARAELIDAFDRCSDWVFPNVGILRLYVYEIDPDISYEKYCRFGKGMERDVAFHLVAYDKFHDVLPEIANGHIEEATSIMKEPTGEKDLLDSSIWVPYLYNGGRTEEIREIAEDILPISPYDHIASFFSALVGCPGSEEMVTDLIESMASSELWDPKASEIVVGHLVSRDRVDAAGPVAYSFFKKRPSEFLAEVAVRWACESCVDLDEAVVAFLRQADTTQSNFTLAEYYRERGEKAQSDALLVRASFCGGELSGRALACYAIEHATDNDDEGNIERVDEDCYVVLSSKDGNKRTLLFVSNPKAVTAEGASNSVGTVFGVRSAEFLSLKGLRLGEACLVDGEELAVAEIGKVSALLCRAGFAELARHPESAITISSVDDLVGHLKEASKAVASKMEMYKNGVTAEEGTIYLGIETGAVLFGPSRRLEFVGEMVCNPNYPYRKCPISRNTPLSEEDRFLLSYNSVIVLSLLNLPADVLDGVKQRCFISKSTAKRLEKDVCDLLEGSYRSSGRLGFDGERPVYFENNDETRRRLKDRWLPVRNLVSQLNTVEPVIDIQRNRISKPLFESSNIDIRTAQTHNLVFVTEDYFESQICDAFKASRRCGVAAVMMCAGHSGYVFTDYVKKMAEWGAEPLLEQDLVELYVKVLSDALGLSEAGVQEPGETDSEAR